MKRIIRNSTAEDGRRMHGRALKLSTAEEIERFVRAEMQNRFGDALAPI